MINFNHIIKKLILTIVFICIASFTYAKNINIQSTHAYLEGNNYYLDTSLDFVLTEEAQKALRHGIPLEIHTHFQLQLIRKWLWNKIISEKKIIFRLEHKPLTENYQTTDLLTGLRYSYNSLDAALKHISTLSKIKLFNLALLQKEENYIGRIRTFLDIESLPSPMRPQAYFSPNWDISSAWYEWEVIQ